MEKIILLVLVLMTLTACGGSDTESSGLPSTNEVVNKASVVTLPSNSPDAKIAELEARVALLEKLILSQDLQDDVHSLMEQMCTNKNRIENLSGFTPLWEQAKYQNYYRGGLLECTYPSFRV